MSSSWPTAKGAAGTAIRRQREFAQLSLRELARVSKVSNAYLSQVERGLHEPSLRVLSAVAEALSVPVEDLLIASDRGRHTRPDDEASRSPEADVERAIRGDTRLSNGQQEALLTVYRSYLSEASGTTATTQAGAGSPP